MHIPAQAGSPDDPPSFRLAENIARYPSRHHAHPGYQIFFSFKNGGEVTISTPEHPDATSPVFWTVDLVHGAWTSLVDPDGRAIPVELRSEDGLCSARWL